MANSASMLQMPSILRHVLLPFVAMAFLSLSSGCADDGEGQIHVYTPRNPSADEQAAAHDLARVLGIMTGEEIVVSREPWLSFAAGDGFYVGDTMQARTLLPELVAKPALAANSRHLPVFDPRPPRPYLPLEPERWDNVGWCADEGRFVIAGSDAGATPLAVSLFMQRELGVRWWIPGELGEDIPSREIPEASDIGRTIMRPSFYSREMYGLRGSDGRAWGVHNLLRGHISMNHALPYLLGKDVAKQHPDWFPAFSGRPFDPATWKGQLPHPVFTNPEAAHKVAGDAIAYFDKNPGKPTFSISPADNGLFGDLDTYEGLVDNKNLFRRKLDYSNAVFTFYNAVAKECGVVHPERYLGALAYSFYENVPDFPVEPNILPFITADRSQWYDADFRVQDLALVRKWAARGPQIIGTWDYYYGHPFMVPRPMLGVVKESLPALHEAGVRAFFCELMPRWGFDAPKAWIAARLLWDAGADPVALEKEFFEGYFGPAAEPMLRFYEDCGAIWNAQPGPAQWIKYYGDADQALLCTAADLRRLRSHVDAALSLELDRRQRERVLLVADALALTERFCAAYPAWERVARWTPERPVRELIEAIPSYLKARADLQEINTSRVGNGLNDLPRELGYLTDDDPLTGRLALLQTLPGIDARPMMGTPLPPDYAELLSRRSVRLAAKPFAKGLDGWTVSGWPEPVERYRVDASSGQLTIAGANSISFHRYFRARAGSVFAATFRASGLVSGASNVRLQMEFFDAAGRQLSVCTDRLPTGALDNALLAVAARAPEGAASVRVLLLIRGQQEGEAVTLGAWPSN